MMRIFIEASGSITSNYLIEAIKDANCEVIGSDISTFNHSKSLCNDFILMPSVEDPKLWEKTKKLLILYKIDIVIPSFDETMEVWASKIDEYKEIGIQIIISPLETIEIFQDKWKTYNFFNQINIPTPRTSLKDEYEIIKPRQGRGGSGIFKNNYKQNISMEGMISQEKIEGTEYTVDVFFTYKGLPLYIIPRKRLDIKEGKSTKGIVVRNDAINDYIIKISENLSFLGPINFQLFETKEKKLIFIEVNPRIAGGMALGFNASQNWVTLIIENIIHKKEVKAKEIKYGLKMARYYNESFFF
ncbi:MAG: carbamoylphosphate synthase large subunit [Arcobacter sp.]|nr:MAG: carbamoylphosphate synthase large subunit [Arcobacter sp.]